MKRMTSLAIQSASDLATTNHLGVDDLRELMRAVTVTTQRLQHTHIALHSQVARLQAELAEANAALRRSQALAALGEMAAGIAHEVRNPLASIQLYVQMLGDDLADRPVQAELCSKISRAVLGLDAIVRDVLSFARDTTIRPETVSVADLFSRALESCETLVRSSGVIVIGDVASDRIVADPVLVVQALANVIRNAVEAIAECGSSLRELKLSASIRRVRCPGGETLPRVVMSVQDTGPGIRPDVLDRVFNPFFTTRATGTGLGLAIVHRIVDAHGGHINIHNVETGGTRVEVCLPLQPIQDAQPSSFNPSSKIEKSEIGVTS
jgi:signal transduction histidine kinase